MVALPAVPLSCSVFLASPRTDVPDAVYSWVRMWAGSRDSLKTWEEFRSRSDLCGIHPGCEQGQLGSINSKSLMAKGGLINTGCHLGFPARAEPSPSSPQSMGRAGSGRSGVGDPCGDVAMLGGWCCLVACKGLCQKKSHSEQVLLAQRKEAQRQLLGRDV